MPRADLLSDTERADLRLLFKDYAFALVAVQKKRDVRSYVEGGAIVAGVLAGKALTGPLTIFGVALFGRNIWANRSWNERREGLRTIAEWIQELL